MKSWLLLLCGLFVSLTLVGCYPVRYADEGANVPPSEDLTPPPAGMEQDPGQPVPVRPITPSP